MGAVPAPSWPAASQTTLISKTRLPGNGRAAAAARTFVREALAGQAAQADAAARGITERLINDAVLLAGELVTSAVMHAGADAEIACLLETGQVPDTSPQGAAPGSASAAPAGERPVGVVVEVADHPLSRSRRTQGCAARRARRWPATSENLGRVMGCDLPAGPEGRVVPAGGARG